jgi:hypothetical protein
MIIGVSGAQGQGKSTLISDCDASNSGGRKLWLQTSRKLLIDWGYTLGDVNKYAPLKVKFQDEIIKRHEKSLIWALEQASEAKHVFLSERTFADIFTYALASIGPHNEYSNWLDEYAEKCSEAQKKYFHTVLFLQGREYVPEDDGVRSVNIHFAHLANSMILHYAETFSNNDSLLVVNVSDRKSRVQHLNARIAKIKEENKWA